MNPFRFPGEDSEHIQTSRTEIMPLTVRTLVGKRKRSRLSCNPPSAGNQPIPDVTPTKEHPGNPLLSCDCARSHTLASKLDAIPEVSYPDTSKPTFTLTPRSNAKDTANRDQTFQYYLPYISDSVNDYYTEQVWVAYDVYADDENEHDGLEREDQWLLPWTQHLPFIQENDFQYYPAGSTSGATSRQIPAEEISRVGTPIKMDKVTKGREHAGEGFWLKVLRGMLRKLTVGEKF